MPLLSRRFGKTFHILKATLASGVRADKSLGCGKDGSCFYQTQDKGFFKDLCDDKAPVCPSKDCNIISGIYNVTEVTFFPGRSWSFLAWGPNNIITVSC